MRNDDTYEFTIFEVKLALYNKDDYEEKKETIATTEEDIEQVEDDREAGDEGLEEAARERLTQPVIINS